MAYSRSALASWERLEIVGRSRFARREHPLPAELAGSQEAEANVAGRSKVAEFTSRYTVVSG
jgi:hypothetical protein